MQLSYVAAGATLTAALIAHQHGDHERAHELLERSLDAGVPEGVVQPYRSRDPRLRELLAAHAAWGTGHGAFVAAQVAALDETRGATPGLGEPLSAREREVFGFLRTSMTAQEIADALFVSVNTVRTHQRAIYRKLGVPGRREAARLRPQGWFPPR
ncbi:helix-turn-helix transcriptional regulator [Tessaracoccus sp. HDW20]|nr:helix-turn-helix transcriptional regulator [Tessaracoccus coleopterorum]